MNFFGKGDKNQPLQNFNMWIIKQNPCNPSNNKQQFNPRLISVKKKRQNNKGRKESAMKLKNHLNEIDYSWGCERISKASKDLSFRNSFVSSMTRSNELKTSRFDKLGRATFTRIKRT